MEIDHVFIDHDRDGNGRLDVIVTLKDGTTLALRHAHTVTDGLNGETEYIYNDQSEAHEHLS